MSDFFYRTLSRITGYFTIGVMFGLYALSANVEIKDLDLWLHLKVGKFIVENGFVPQYDVLSNSIAGKPWINHEWLFQVIIYTIKNMWGFEGLVTMQVLVVLLTIAILLFLGYNERRQGIIVFTLLLVLFNYQMRFTIRPDIFSLLFFVFYMQLLSTKLHERWCVPVIFLAQVLWSNIHGFFFLGPIFVSMAVLAEFIKRNIPLPWEWNSAGRLTDDEYQRLQIIWFVVIGACLINPYFIEGAIYPIKVLMNMSGDNKIFFRHIVELQRPVASWQEFFSAGDYLHYRILIFLSFLSFVFNRRKLDIAALFFWLAFLGFSLSASRNLVFFSFAAYLVIMVNMQTIRLDDIAPVRFTHERFKHISIIIAKLGLILWMINYGSQIMNNGYFNFDTYERKSEFEGVSLRNYPYKAVDFLVKNKIQGNFFNDFNSGAYLIGRTYPDIKPFIDGRTEVYGSDFFTKQYLKLWGEGDVKLFDKLSEKYSFTGAFINYNSHQAPEKTVKMFVKKKDWVPVYFDRDALILLKDIPQNKAVIDRFRIDFKTWEPPELNLRKLSSKPILPVPNINRAYTLFALEQYELALKETDLAEKVAPQSVEIYKLRGKIFEALKKYQLEFENYRIASSMFPSDANLHGKLGLAYEQIGDYQGAIAQFEKVLRNSPNDSLAYYSMSRFYARLGKIEKARELLRRAIALDPDNSVELFKIGDIMYQLKEYDRALAIYKKTLYGSKSLGKSHYKIGLTYLVQRKYQEAKTHFKKSLDIDPSGDFAKKAASKLSKLSVIKTK